MPLKDLLGLKGCKIPEHEIMARLQEAYMSKKDSVVFNGSDGEIVTLRINQVDPIGIIRREFT